MVALVVNSGPADHNGVENGAASPVANPSPVSQPSVVADTPSADSGMEQLVAVTREERAMLLGGESAAIQESSNTSSADLAPASRFSFAAIADTATHVWRSAVSAEYRHALAREEHVDVLRDSSASREAKILSTNALGSLLDPRDRMLTVGASVSEAVHELKLVVNDRAEHWHVRAGALSALSKRYTADGVLDRGFAGEIGRALVGETDAGMIAAFSGALSTSDNQFAQAALFEKMTEGPREVVALAGQALQASMALAPNPSVERTLEGIVGTSDAPLEARRTALRILADSANREYLGAVATVIANPKEHFAVRALAVELYGASRDEYIQGALLTLAGQNKSTDHLLVEQARLLAGQAHPGMVIRPELGPPITLGHYSPK
ncbi:MAG: hypothetical protein J0M12_11900 [Deltaproteobacteria bacterium]|nr:hypothetical protein [Deltaproteobacteria bacterium]